MYSDSDDEIIFDNTIVKALCIINSREYCVHPLNQKRFRYGEYHHLFMDLENYPDRFFQYLRMNVNTFHYIVDLLSPYLTNVQTNFIKQPIGPKEKLVITFRYLITGSSFKNLSFAFRVGASTVAAIVKQTVQLLWKYLQPKHMPVPTKEMFLQVSEEFMKLWNFPNCIGAIDGKHVRIKQPPHSGTMFFNYKQLYSIVLQGVSDANYRFIIIDVGGYGKQSDGGTFNNSAMFKLMQTKTLNIPEDIVLPGTNVKMPFVFIADEAYPLTQHLLKPYNRTDDQMENIVFNSRLSRARKSIECAFGILYSKFRILSKSIEVNDSAANNIIKAVCILHNTIIDKEGIDRQLHTMEHFCIPLQASLRRHSTGRISHQAKQVRDVFKMYVNNNPITYST